MIRVRRRQQLGTVADSQVSAPFETVIQEASKAEGAYDLPRYVSKGTPKSCILSYKRSLQGVMYSVTIRLGLNPSTKDRRWSLGKKLIFSRKIPRWILGGIFVHLHIGRPRSLVI